jgi:hypothetical protein
LARKILTIIFLAVSLGLSLYLRPYFFKKPPPPRIVDRLPDADFLGKANLLELARETSSMMYYHKIPFRDFTSYEFILGQSKMYGLNLQKPVYIFGNERGDWGALLHVTDSSKMSQGIDRIKNFLDIRDTILFDTKVWFYPAEKTYLHYGKNYLLVYRGKYINKVLDHVVNANLYGESKVWRKFLSKKQFSKENLVIFSNWKKLKEIGFKTAMFAHDSDSLSFNLKSYFYKNSPFYFTQKREGIAIRSLANATRSLELHLNIDEFKKHTEDSLMISMMQFGRRIGFPMMDFLKAWDGDLSFVEGGIQKVKEKYVSTELDDEFNVLEVEKTREIEVPGYSLVMSTTPHSSFFINRLFQKGILRKDGNQFRVLFSPLLHFTQTKSMIRFHSGQIAPVLINGNQSNVVWTNKGTKYSFYLDSLNSHELFGNLKIPVEGFFKRNRLITN